MASPNLEDPWGLLISSNEDRIPILSRKFTIGRRNDSDHVIENKCVSSSHCYLEYSDDGHVWLHDTSTNGTLVDGVKVHQSKAELRDGSVVKIVFRKDQPDLSLCYTFNSLLGNAEEQPAESQDSQKTIEMTVDDGCYDNDCSGNDDYTSILKRKSSELSSDTPDPKRQALEPSDSNQQVQDSNTDEGADQTVPFIEDSTANDDSEDKVKETEKADKELPTSLVKKDSIEETLICQICQEILHDCVSLQPCMHSYCAGCYSDWMEYSQECPACRNKVDRISKNHIVNNLVNAYLRANPDKKRSDEDLKELDEKNKITESMLYPKRKGLKSLSVEDYSEDDEEEDSDSTSSYDSTSCYSSSKKHSSISSAFPPLFPIMPSLIPSPMAPVPVTCRQCPSHTPLTLSTGSSSFVCLPSTNHILCNCCLQPMPDRRTDPDLSIPPQKCDVCSKAFCHMYWGCGKFGCKGCLNMFKDMEFTETILEYLINDNYYESQIVENYLEDKGLSLKEMVKDCLDQLDSGTFTSSDTRSSRISSLTRVCYQCALKNLKDLAYQYREKINGEDLPANVHSRTDCYYGKNCRTQKHNRDHCKKYNHICEQKRF